MATIEDVIQFRDELKEKFGGTENVAYANISETQLSIAKYSFGAKIHGKHYVYNPIDDSLIREDVVKWIAYHKKSKEAPKKPVDQSQQLDMDY